MPEKELLVLCGSETGTALDFGETLWRECKRRGVGVRVYGFDEYNLNDLPNQPVFVFIVSTSGQGDVPVNMLDNWRRLLNARIPTNWLDHSEFLGVGLGDSSYQKFNFAAKKLNRRLEGLGARNLAENGVFLCDDQHQFGPYGTFDEFLLKLWKVLEDKKELFPNFHAEPDSTFPMKYEVDRVDNPQLTTGTSIDYTNVQCVKNDRVTTEDHFQDTRLITLSLDESEEAKLKLRYEPGDILMVHPQNLPESVQLAIQTLNLTPEQLDTPVQIQPAHNTIKPLQQHMASYAMTGYVHESRPTCTVTTLRTLLDACFDLQAIPRPSFFATLSRLSRDPTEQERLTELSQSANVDEYLDYAQRPRRTVAEALRDFPATSAQLFAHEAPQEVVAKALNVFSTIRPRAFSIASPPSTHGNSVQILVAKVNFKLVLMKERRQGLCSTFLSRLEQDQRVYVKIRKGTFRFEPALNAPSTSAQICIGPGTGIAPFRSFVMELDNRLRKDKPEENGTQRKTLVFFGCRNSEKDFYFRQEWMTEVSSSEMKKSWLVIPAFSRPNPPDQGRYVQDLIRANEEKVWEWIQDKEAKIFVAGRSKAMPDGVTEALKQVASSVGKVSDPDAYFEKLEKTGKVQFECWD